ncbi:aspartyl protease family protein At5g10770-like isoform X1 [Brassica napus]|uniref:aspartyl protease family protein At5g10770-like isoform X1 n=1 Tax=Brassica napus TaxID=3708 RepID=UPI002078FFD1|nr:aspartyl protease family protein At5g10770-like isoform X1 [Brassica napus]
MRGSVGVVLMELKREKVERFLFTEFKSALFFLHRHHRVFLFSKKIIMCSFSESWGRTDGAQKRESGEVSFHRIQASSLFPSPSSSCVLSPRASNTKSSLHVVHRHGPCSSLSSKKADHDEILRLDQARVKSIHSKLSKKLTARDRVSQSQSTDLPARDGITFGYGNYVVTVGIGTPKHDLSLFFDTGSDITWTQCQPCAGKCYSQKEPIFNPSSSSSYSNVSCSSPVCDSLTSQGLVKQCSASNCIYLAGYGDKSFTQGFMAKEKFTLNSDVFDSLNFGCGQNNQGLFTGIAGLLGLGRGSFSFPSQTAKTYNNIFSYCLPSSPQYTGHLTFGSAGLSNSLLKYTPVSTVKDSSSLYGLDIVGISVDDKELKIPLTVFSTPGAIIDSGTVITRLPPKAYAALRTAFKEKMSNYTAAAGLPPLDTCYDFTGVESIDVPKVSFSFKGGTVVELEPIGVLFVADRSQVCLAFIANDKDDDVAILGNVQQKTLQVVYDGPGGRVGFAPNGCN